MGFQQLETATIGNERLSFLPIFCTLTCTDLYTNLYRKEDIPMPVTDLTITEARQKLPSLPERLADDPGTVVITRRGKPVLAILSWDLYEAIIETLEILEDETLMTALRQSLQDLEAGRTSSMEEVKRELGL